MQKTSVGNQQNSCIRCPSLLYLHTPVSSYTLYLYILQNILPSKIKPTDTMRELSGTKQSMLTLRFNKKSFDDYFDSILTRSSNVLILISSLFLTFRTKDDERVLRSRSSLLKNYIYLCSFHHSSDSITQLSWEFLDALLLLTLHHIALSTVLYKCNLCTCLTKEQFLQRNKKSLVVSELNEIEHEREAKPSLTFLPASPRVLMHVSPRQLYSPNNRLSTVYSYEIPFLKNPSIVFIFS